MVYSRSRDLHGGWLSLIAGAFAVVVRWVHLLASMSVVGAVAFAVVAGRSDRPTVLRWERYVVRWSRGAVVLALVSGVAVLLIQTATFVGRPGAAFEPASIARVLMSTQAGLVWLARHGLLVVLAAFLWIDVRLDQKLDWIAVRGESLVLALVAVGLLSFSSHAVAVAPGRAAAVAADVIHVIGTGIWLGGLLPLTTLLAMAGTLQGADARPYAVLAARKFSSVALVAMLVLIVTGVVNSVNEIGSIAGLVGTTHGHLLLAKLTLLAPILVLGALNRTRVLPALSGAADTVGRPAMRRLATFVGIEAALAIVLLVVVAMMVATPPGRHEQPTWPFPFRLTAAAIAAAPALQTRVLIAGQLAVLGVVALTASALLSKARWPVWVGGLALVLAGGGIALPPLIVDAYPSTYQRPATPYTALSIATGAEIFRERCAACHGATGEGDGPARGGPRPPANLRSGHPAVHTAGDLFWVISHGIPGSTMPAFEAQIGAKDRWSVVNFLRALADGGTTTLGAAVEPNRARVIAPDFAYSVGPTHHALKEFRGNRIVLLVLYSLPGSRARLTELASAYDTFRTMGAEVVAVPLDAAPDAIQQIGAAPRVLFPVVTDGAADIVAAYGLFGTGAHAEFLIDRQGYLRARWTGDLPATRDVASRARGADAPLGLPRTLAELQELNQEKVLPPPAAEHVH